MRSREEQTHLDALIMQLQQELNPSIKLPTRLSRRINISQLPTPHLPLLMIHLRTHDPIPNRLGDDILRVFLAVQRQFRTDVGEGDTGVGEGEGAEGRFDDGVAEAVDEGEGAVVSELRGVGGEGGVEGLDVADADGCGKKNERAEGGQ